MPIEFACSVCQSVLRTADETAGKAARCPSCGNVQAIPAGTGDSPFQSKFGMPPVGAESSPPYKSPKANQDSGQGNPFQSPSLPVNNPYASVAPSEHHFRPFDLQAAKSRVLPPAITLLVLNCITLLLTGFGLFGGLMELADGRAENDDLVMLVVVALMMAIILVGIGGCVCMLMFRNRGLAIAGAICSMVSGFYCCFIPTGFAIWALVVVLDNQVKPFFR